MSSSPEHPFTISILGCGWLGRPLGAHFVREGHTVHGSTTTPDKLDALHADGIEPFLLRLAPDLDGERADLFFRADVLFLNVPPPRGQDDLRAYHLRQIDAVRQAVQASPITWVIFASSTGVYPRVEGTVTEEDALPHAPGAPDGPRGPRRKTGEVLLAAEELLRQAEGFSTTVVRFAGLYGGDRHPGRFLAGRMGVTRPEAPVNLIHRDDCIGVVEAIIEQDARDDTFNACADAHPTRRAFYSYAAEALGLEPPSFADDDTTGKIVSNQKVKEQLGYVFQHPDPMQGRT